MSVALTERLLPPILAAVREQVDAMVPEMLPARYRATCAEEIAPDAVGAVYVSEPDDPDEDEFDAIPANAVPALNAAATRLFAGQDVIVEFVPPSGAVIVGVYVETVENRIEEAVEPLDDWLIDHEALLAEHDLLLIEHGTLIDANTTALDGLAVDLIALDVALGTLDTDLDALAVDLAALDVEVGTLDSDLSTLASDLAALDVEVGGILPIEEVDISSDAISAPKIQANAVVAGKIAANAVTATTVAAGAITAGKLSAGAVTAGTIAAGSIVAADIAAGTITATNIAAGTITTTEIAAGTITASDIATGTLTANEIAAGTITGSRIAGTTITATNIAAGTITGTEIAGTTITGTHISGSVITGTHLSATLTLVTGKYVQSANYPSSGFRLDATGGLDVKSGGGTFAGALSAATGTFAGSLSAATGTFAGSLSAATGTFAGSLSAASGTFTGTLSGASGTFSGSVTVGTSPTATFDSSGLTMPASNLGVPASINSIRWMNGATLRGRVWGDNGAGSGGILYLEGAAQVDLFVTGGPVVRISPTTITLTGPVSITGSGDDLTLNGGDIIGAGAGTFSGNLDAASITVNSAPGAGVPPYAFDGDPDTGLFSGGANVLGITTGGTRRARIDSASFDVESLQLLAPTGGGVGTPGVASTGDPDTGLFWPTGNVLSVATGGTRRVRVDSASVDIESTQLLVPQGTAATPGIGIVGGGSTGIFRSTNYNATGLNGIGFTTGGTSVLGATSDGAVWLPAVISAVTSGNANLTAGGRLTRNSSTRDLKRNELPLDSTDVLPKLAKAATTFEPVTIEVATEAAMLGLKPKTIARRYGDAGWQPRQPGLIAEIVAEADPKLAELDDAGEVTYYLPDGIIAYLLDGWAKHEATIARLTKRIEDLERPGRGRD